jgi:hypothetical protein
MGTAPAGLTQALISASDAIRNYCRWHIWPSVSETVVLDGTGGLNLFLPSLRVTAVTSISETQRGATETPQTVNVTDVEWSASGMIRRHDNQYWTTRYRGVTVVFTHGYDDLPEEIVQLAVGVAGRVLSNPTRLAQVTVGQRSESYGGSAALPGLLFDEAALLGPYRRLV